MALLIFYVSTPKKVSPAREKTMGGSVLPCRGMIIPAWPKSLWKTGQIWKKTFDQINSRGRSLSHFRGLHRKKNPQDASDSGIVAADSDRNIDCLSLVHSCSIAFTQVKARLPSWQETTLGSRISFSISAQNTSSNIMHVLEIIQELQWQESKSSREIVRNNYSRFRRSSNL